MENMGVGKSDPIKNCDSERKHENDKRKTNVNPKISIVESTRKEIKSQQKKKFRETQLFY